MNYKYQILPVLLLLLFSSCIQKQPDEQANGRYTESYRPQIHFSPEEGWLKLVEARITKLATIW